MQTVYVNFSEETEADIATYWGGPQADPAPFYAELPSDDERYVAWFDRMLTMLPSYITDSFIKPGT